MYIMYKFIYPCWIAKYIWFDLIIMLRKISRKGYISSGDCCYFQLALCHRDQYEIAIIIMLF